MACQFCVKKISERLEALPGVVSPTVSLAEKSARVIIQQERVSPRELITVIERAGFKANLISVESSEKN